MHDANLLASLARLSLNAAFVLASVIWYYKQQREIPDATIPAFEQKTEQQWAAEISTLTPEEILTLASLAELFGETRPTLSANATYVITSAMSSLPEPNEAPYTTAPTPIQKTGGQWAAELARLTPENIAKVASVITQAREPGAFTAENLTIQTDTGTSRLVSRIWQTLAPKAGQFQMTEQEYQKNLAREANLQKKIDAAFRPTRAQLAEPERPAIFEKLAPPTPQKQPAVKPTLTIERIPYPKWWRDSLNAKINLTAPGSAILAKVSGPLILFVSTIVITVTGETEISFTFGGAGSGGPLYLGGEGQPMGIVIAMGNSPAPCEKGSLVITATDPGGANPSVGGWATCFAMPEKA